MKQMKKENKTVFSFSIWKKTAMIGLDAAPVIKLMFLQSILSIKYVFAFHKKKQDPFVPTKVHIPGR